MREARVHKYDPEQAPQAKSWLSIDERERIDLVYAYHRKQRIQLPNAELHASLHTMVENQIAEGYAPTVDAMARLREEGLSRHDSVHAVAWILALHINDLMRSPHSLIPSKSNERLEKAIDKLTAQLWLDQEDELLFDD